MNRIFFLVLLFWTCGAIANPEPTRVSLLKLIATPEKYSGKLVAVEGYLHVKFEDSVLYLTKDHADRLMGKEGLWVNYSDEISFLPTSENNLGYFDAKWVTLIGVFEFSGEQNHGHLSTNSGTLNKVSRVMEQRQWYDGSIELDR